jgi:hypothetical protein
MMNSDKPWDGIKTPDADYNVRKIAAASPIPLYWAKDVTGHCLLVAELEGDHSAQFLKESVSVHGVRVDLRQSEIAHHQKLVLTLEKHVDDDLFLGLCKTLIAGLDRVSDPATALAVSLSHIKRWRAFLSGRKTKLLSPEEIRGLFAELDFLRSLYQRRLPEKASMDAWCGAEASHQDFIFGNTAAEIKSLSGKERSAVRISSEDQLEALCDHLFLVVIRLSEIHGSKQALSLNDAVLRIERELTDADAMEAFSGKLAGFGYAPLNEYDSPRLQVSSTRVYRVTEPFPRLMRSRLPEGVVKVSYDIELEAIAPFVCDIEEVFVGG